MNNRGPKGRGRNNGAATVTTTTTTTKLPAVSSKAKEFIPRSTITTSVVSAAVEAAKPKFNLEEAVDSLRCYLEICSDDYFNDDGNNDKKDVDDVLTTMEAIRTGIRAYHYVEEYRFCPEAFIRYLERSSGVSFTPHHIRDLIYESMIYTDSYWDALSLQLIPVTEELYILKCYNSKVLIGASELGYKDSRLETAIINIQRLIRSNTDMLPSVRVDSFLEDELPFFIDENEERSFVMWNSSCVCDYFINYITVDTCDHSILDGVDTFIFGDDGVESISGLMRSIRNSFYCKNIGLIANDDSITKLYYLTQIYAEGQIHAKRNRKRDEMKFINYSLPDLSKATRVSIGCCKKNHLIAEYLYGRLNDIPYGVLKILFKILPSCLSNEGARLMREFSKVKVSELTVSEVRKWYMELVTEDGCEDDDEARKLSKFLERGKEYTNTTDFCRKKLVTVHSIVTSGKPLIQKSFENVVVRSVTM